MYPKGPVCQHEKSQQLGGASVWLRRHSNQHIITRHHHAWPSPWRLTQSVEGSCHTARPRAHLPWLACQPRKARQRGLHCMPRGPRSAAAASRPTGRALSLGWRCRCPGSHPQTTAPAMPAWPRRRQPAARMRWGAEPPPGMRHRRHAPGGRRRGGSPAPRAHPQAHPHLRAEHLKHMASF